jgi:hypothetical protein
VDKALAIEENGAEFLLALGRAAGAEERDDGRIRWAIGNSPIDYHNCVVHADLTREEADGEIEASLERMRAHGVPGSWHVGPSMRPSDLDERLIAHGFEYGGDDIGMAVDLSTLPEGVPAPENFVVERVRGEAGLAAWIEALGSGFGAGPVEAEWAGEMYRRLGLGDEGPWRHYVGLLAGEDVHILLGGRGRGDLLRVHRRACQTAGDRSWNHTSSAPRSKGSRLLGRCPRLLRDGLSRLPQAGLRGILQDRALRVAFWVGGAHTGHRIR